MKPSRVSTGDQLAPFFVKMSDSAAKKVAHHVWFGWKEGTSAETIEKTMEELRALKDKIPEIVEIHCGSNFTQRAPGFTHGLTVILKDKASLPVYADHPEHQRVLNEHIKPHLEKVQALDYEY